VPCHFSRGRRCYCRRAAVRDLHAIEGRAEAGALFSCSSYPQTINSPVATDRRRSMNVTSNGRLRVTALSRPCHHANARWHPFAADANLVPPIMAHRRLGQGNCKWLAGVAQFQRIGRPPPYLVIGPRQPPFFNGECPEEFRSRPIRNRRHGCHRAVQLCRAQMVDS
jgi:hypothetical protein